jgi:hypothetical protein
MAFYKTKNAIAEFETAVLDRQYRTRDGFHSYAPGTFLEKLVEWDKGAQKVVELFEPWDKAEFDRFFEAATDEEVKSFNEHLAQVAAEKAKSDQLALEAEEKHASEVRIVEKRKRVAGHPNAVVSVDTSKMTEPELDAVLQKLDNPDPAEAANAKKAAAAGERAATVKRVDEKRKLILAHKAWPVGGTLDPDLTEAELDAKINELDAATEEFMTPELAAAVAGSTEEKKKPKK